MAVTGYENSNGKIAYPFMDGVLSANTPYLTPNFLVDFQFIDFTNTIKSVYISRITNVVFGNLIIYFNNATTTDLIGTITVASSEAVNHVGNLSASFVSTQTDDYSIKVVFGPGVVSIIASNFDTTYLPDETTFSPATIVLYHPKLEGLIVKNNYPTSTVETYTAGDNISFLPGANIDSVYNDGMSLAVFQRAGTGLFNPCSDGPAEVLFTINDISPDVNGNFFVATDNCYSMSVLSQVDLTAYSANLATYTDASIPFEAGHSFIIQNNCTAKCPPESLNALADYINRLRDGVQELYDFAVQPSQTTGTAGATTEGSFDFTASEFSTVEVGAAGFIKYFHEGHKITINYGAANAQTTTIASVLSTSQITVSDAITTTTSSGTAAFTVDDLGVYNKLNNAISSYNTAVATTINVPYGQIIYTTTEGTNELGEYGTFISVVAAIYNPSTSNVYFNFDFIPSTNLELEAGTAKLRQDGTVTVDPTFPVSLACKDYATFESVFFLISGLTDLLATGEVTVNITSSNTVDGTYTTISKGSTTISVSSVAAPIDGDTTTPQLAIKDIPFSYNIPTGTATGELVVGSITPSAPSWLVINTSLPPISGSNFSGIPTETTNTTYLIISTIFSEGTTNQYNLIIDVVAPPVVTSASVSAEIGASFLYPVIATNQPTFSATGLDGTGLSIDSLTGVISGIPLAGALGTLYPVITATNAAGASTGVITLMIDYGLPVIYSTLTQTPTLGVNFSYQILATNTPSGSTYGATGLSGSGLSIDTSTGIISGTPTTSGTLISSISVTTDAGTDTKTLVLNISTLPPVVYSSTSVTGAVGLPFSYLILAHNAPTSYPTVTGLPAGITQTGNLLSGTPTAGGSFNITISAENSAGIGTAILRMVIASTLPVITSSLAVQAIVGSPFIYQIVATNNPTSFSASGLPSVLSITSGGLISGTIMTTGLTSFSITATNGTGSDTELLQINTINASTPVINSSLTANFDQGLAGSYQITATNYPTIYAASPLPAGLSINTTSGLIYGIPTTPGSTTTTISATNAASTPTGTASLTITVVPEPPVIVSSSNIFVRHSGPLFYSISASNSPTYYSFSGPTWLTLTGNNISGTAPSSPGTTSMNVSAGNDVGTTSLTVTINIT